MPERDGGLVAPHADHDHVALAQTCGQAREVAVGGDDDEPVDLAGVQDVHRVDDERGVGRVLARLLAGLVALDVTELLDGRDGVVEQLGAPLGRLRVGEVAVDAAVRRHAVAGNLVEDDGKVLGGDVVRVDEERETRLIVYFVVHVVSVSVCEYIVMSIISLMIAHVKSCSVNRQEMSTTRQLPRGRERKAKWKGNAMAELRPEDLNATKPDCLSGTALEQKAESAGLAKTQMEVGRTIVLALMAGMLIGSGALFMTCVKADPTLGFAASNILGGFCFSLGLICVIVAGAELFTGNCLMVMGAASKRFAWAKVLKNWVVVWLGNFAGSLVLVGIVSGCSIMAIKAGDNTIGAQMVTVASGKDRPRSRSDHLPRHHVQLPRLPRGVDGLCRSHGHRQDLHDDLSRHGLRRHGL